MTRKLPEKFKTCDWLWNYGSIGLTKEHIKRLNNAINILESLNEHTDAKYLKEIKDKLLEDIPEIKPEKTNTDAIIEKACDYLRTLKVQEFPGAPMERVMTEEDIDAFRKAMEE